MLMKVLLASAVIASVPLLSTAIDNGLGITPPMGWRSWNLFGANVNQNLMESIMDGVSSRKRSVDGVPTSLCDLGYCNVGLDDNWQKCGAYGPSFYTYHDADGNPVVNTDRFPSLKAMTDYAHSLNLSAGWYGNNCICSDHCTDDSCYKGDVAALVQYGFDAVKLDGCGKEYDLNKFASLINATGRPVTIENCHWGNTVPNNTWCPWNFYRTSGDVRASYSSIISNLQTTVHFAQQNLSTPGCWAYPDMLEVGCAHGPGGPSDPGLSFQETRSHFGAWCIVSSPLTLSHDTNNDTITDFIWPIIANPEAIAVNQGYAGESGAPFASASTSVTLRDSTHNAPIQAPSYQFFSKALLPNGGKTAVLLMNHETSAYDLTFNFADVASIKCTTCKVRDVWARKDLGTFTGNFTAQAVDGHDAAFLTITPA